MLGPTEKYLMYELGFNQWDMQVGHRNNFVDKLVETIESGYYEDGDFDLEAALEILEEASDRLWGGSGSDSGSGSYGGDGWNGSSDYT